MALKRNATPILVLVACALLVAFPVRASEPAQRPVYVVPDVGTYLYAISLWDKDIQFPIFIGEGRFLDIFLKGYPGAELKKLEPKRVGKISEALVYRALYAAWGPETLDDAPPKVGREELKARLETLGVVPRGIVVTDLDDAEFAGGLALAAGHREILAFYKSPAERSLQVEVARNSASEATEEKIRRDVLGLVKEWGYPYEGLGEDRAGGAGIDYITLALNVRHTYYRKRTAREGQDPGYAITDMIGRLTPSGLVEEASASGPKPGEPAVYAYCGQLIEAAPQMALFQAMSSLFAETDRALYFHRWAAIHGLEGVKGYQVLRTRVHTISRDQRSQPRATLEQWHRLTDGGHKFGFIHVAAVGGAYNWFDGKVDDVPEGRPCAVFFAQSGSAANPAVTDTLAGRWLLNGAYVYYGAATEPQAPAFNSAQSVAQALVAGATYGEAFQRKETLPEPFRKPWRLVYVGDPLARPHFTDDPDEPDWSRTWRRAVAVLRQADYRQAVMLMEGVFADAPAGRVDELWRDLLRAYELTLGIGTLDVPDPKRFFTPTFIDGWMLPADVAEYRPEIGWQARLHLRMVKDGDLSDLLASRLKIDKLPEDLKRRLRGEIGALEVAATFAKMWVVLGPLNWDGADENRMPQAFPSEIPGTASQTYPGPDGPVRWTPRLVEPETHLVELPGPKSEAAALYTAVTFVQVPGGGPHEAALKLAGSELATKPAPLVWVNREPVEAKDASAARSITLKGGTNEIVVRLAVRGKLPGPITFGMSLTEPNGKRSRAFEYVDLIKHLRARSPSGREGQ
jgi:hypothetical protein